MADGEGEILQPADLGRKLVVALRSVTEPQAIMQSIADRSVATLRSELTTRLDAIEKAIEVAHDDLVRVPTEVQRHVHALRELIESKLEGLANADAASTLQRGMLLEQIDKANQNLRVLHDEKFRSIGETIAVFKDSVNGRFQLIAEQTDKAARDVKSAVDAAFAAAASGVSQQNTANALASAKQEGAFTKQIESLVVTVAQTSKSNDDKLEAVKKNNDERFGDLKDRVVAMEGRKGGSDANSAWIATLVGILIGVGGVVIAAIALITTHRS